MARVIGVDCGAGVIHVLYRWGCEFIDVNAIRF